MRHLILVISLLSLSACAAPGWFRDHAVGLQDGRLHPCPEPPRCRSSDASPTDERHYVAPWQLAADADEQTWNAIVRVVQAQPRTRIVVHQDHYLHAVISSPWGWYEDDLELHWRPSQQTIALRSSGRIGWYDFAVNIERIEHLRQQLRTRQFLPA